MAAATTMSVTKGLLAQKAVNRMPRVTTTRSVAGTATKRTVVCACAGDEGDYGMNPVSQDDDVLAIGLATCFMRDDNNEMHETYIVEPVPASAYEALLNGAKTAYKAVVQTTYGKVKNLSHADLPEEFANGKFADEFLFRAEATCRTWKRQHAVEVILPQLGDAVQTDFFFDLTHKRILNEVYEVNDSDNIKQDMSIDVYNRDKGSEEDAISELYNV